MRAARARWPRNHTIRFWVKFSNATGTFRPKTGTRRWYPTDRFRGVDEINLPSLLSRCPIIRPVSPPHVSHIRTELVPIYMNSCFSFVKYLHFTPSTSTNASASTHTFGRNRNFSASRLVCTTLARAS